MINISEVTLNKLKEKAKEHLLKKIKKNSNDIFLLNLQNNDKYITVPIL